VGDTYSYPDQSAILSIFFTLTNVMAKTQGDTGRLRRGHIAQRGANSGQSASV